MDTNNLGLGPLIRLWGIKSEQLPSRLLVKVGAETGAGGVGVGGTRDKSKSDEDNIGNRDDGTSNKRDQGNSGSSGSSSTQEELTNFLGSLLREAVLFIDDVTPKGIHDDDDDGDKKMRTETKPGNKTRGGVWKSKGSKSYEKSIKVDLFERVISAKELEAAATASQSGKPVVTGGETWICRRSIHEDKQEKGAASWEEFRDCFKERHPETEALFTPSVIKMDKRIVWDCEGVPPQKIANDTYSNFTLCILEARHRVGKPLKDRTFPILQMTCSAMNTSSTTPVTATATATSTDKLDQGHNQKEKREFLVITVTIPDYFDSTFSFRDAHQKGGSKTKTKTDTRTRTTNDTVEKDTDKDNDTVIASYASIERIRQLQLSPELPGEDDGTGKIEWLMALTSDARGILPRWIQNLAVPGQIAKDVPLFLDWIGREREKAR